MQHCIGEKAMQGVEKAVQGVEKSSPWFPRMQVHFQTKASAC